MFGAAAVGVSAYFYIDHEIKTPANTKDTVLRSFTILSGESLDKISKKMAEAGIIKKDIYFKIYLWKKELAGSIQAGEYNLSGSMTIGQIADVISKGRAIDQSITVMFPEGLTAKEIEKILVEKKIIKSGELLDAVSEESVQKIYPPYKFFEGKPESQGLEGYLFPDTYKLYKGATAEDMVKKMLANFDAKLTEEMRAEISAQRKDIFEVLTLASIVQEEAGNFSDMKIVAGIFQNRLQAGMMLQADSTVNFVTGKKMPQALFSDLEIDSPYNTYKYAGLPPGPISNPGIDAIKAVIWPERSDYLYFLTTPEGKAIYSKTYAEHLKNKAKYL